MSKRRPAIRRNGRKANGAAQAIHDKRQAGQGWFTWFAHTVARFAGKPATFLTALGLIVV